METEGQSHTPADIRVEQQFIWAQDSSAFFFFNDSPISKNFLPNPVTHDNTNFKADHASIFALD